MNQRIDGLAIVAILLALFMAFSLLKDRQASPGLPQSNTSLSPQADPGHATRGSVIYVAAVFTRATSPYGDPSAINYPYDDFTLTQGPHGASYGHLAIDLAAGEGAPIKSPINGQVTALYTDQYGNPTLVIENEIYRVSLLHGKYSVALGDMLPIGALVGEESNIGYTTDMQGRSCRNRDCGYHTHLNVYDKRLGENVNPLVVLGNQPD